jgi:hypothetical protein
MARLIAELYRYWVLLVMMIAGFVMYFLPHENSHYAATTWWIIIGLMALGELIIRTIEHCGSNRR